MTDSDACRYCGGPTQRPATGRPPLYCSIGCRRASEYEIRRLSRRLEGLERKRDELEVEHAIETAKGDNAYQRIFDRIAAESETVGLQVERYRERLRALLEAEETDESPDTLRPIDPEEPTARLFRTILVDVLRRRERADLLAAIDRDGGLFLDHPEGIELVVGSESVTVVSDEAVRLGLELQAQNELAHN